MRGANRTWGRSMICTWMASFASRTNAKLYERYLDELVDWIVDTKVTPSARTD